MDNIKAFANELEALCLKHNVRIEHRTDYEYDGQINEYTYVEHIIAVVDIENGFNHKLHQIVNLPIGPAEQDE